MHSLRFTSLLFLLFLNFIYSSPLMGLKDAHFGRSLLAAGLLVTAGAIDISKQSDLDACDRSYSALDTRSFAEKWVDRLSALSISKNWIGLLREAVHVICPTKNEKRTFLKRVQMFGKKHRLISFMLALNVVNAGISGFQLLNVKSLPEDKMPIKQTKKSVDSVVSDSGDGNQTHDLKKRLKRRVLVRGRLRLSRTLKNSLVEKKLLKRCQKQTNHAQADICTLAASPCCPVRFSMPSKTDPGVSIVSLNPTEDLGSATLKTPIKHGVTSEMTPDTVDLTPGILTRNGALEIGPGHYMVGVTPLQGLSKKQRLRVMVPGLTIKGSLGGQPMHKGARFGWHLDGEGLAKVFGSPDTRVRDGLRKNSKKMRLVSVKKRIWPNKKI